MAKSEGDLRDPLTELELRGAYEEWSVAKHALQKPIVFILLDVDYFKRINDTAGHPVGDAALKGIGSTVRRLVERYTSVRAFRYGGDELVIAMAGYTLDEGLALARTVAAEVNLLSAELSGTRLTLSIGITTSDTSSLDHLLHDADIALRQAKDRGRNRIEVFAATAPPPPARQRLIINPALFTVLDKKLRLAFLRTPRYHHAAELVATHAELPLKCVSLLGRTDLLVAHLGDREHRFLADLEPLLGTNESGDERAIEHFEVSRIIKFHGHELPPKSAARRDPDRETLKLLLEYAEGREEIDSSLITKWVTAGYALGLEAVDDRGLEIEAYVTMDVLFGRDDPINRELFDIILTEDLMPDTHVVSIYEGHGVNMNVQFVLRTRSTSSQLFDFIEFLHKRCHRLKLPSIRTSTYMVVQYKASRLYRSLLIPRLTEKQKDARDVLILPELQQDEQIEFLFGRPEDQPAVIDAVITLDDVLTTISIPPDLLSPRHVQGLRKRAIRATVTGDRTELGQVHMDLWAIVEPALRTLAVNGVARHFANLKAAHEAKVITSQMLSKQLENLTLGESRDLLRAFHSTKHKAAKLFPSEAALDSLQPLIALRNRFAHGEHEKVEPAEATRLLAKFVHFIGETGSILWGKEASPSEE